MLGICHLGWPTSHHLRMGVSTARAPLLTLQGRTPCYPVLSFETPRTDAAFVYVLPFLGHRSLPKLGTVQCRVGVGILFAVYNTQWGSLIFVRRHSKHGGDRGGLVLVRSTFGSLDTMDVGVVPLCIAAMGRFVFCSRDETLVLRGDGVSFVEKDFL